MRWKPLQESSETVIFKKTSDFELSASEIAIVRLCSKGRSGEDVKSRFVFPINFESWFLLNIFIVCLLIANANPGRRSALLSKEEEPKPFDRRAVLEAGKEAKAKEAAAREGSAQCVPVRVALTVSECRSPYSPGRPKIVYFVSKTVQDTY